MSHTPLVIPMVIAPGSSTACGVSSHNYTTHCPGEAILRFGVYHFADRQANGPHSGP